MGLRILAILLTIHALIGPSLAAVVSLHRPEPPRVATCCASACCCEVACGCTAQELPEQTSPTPAAPPRTTDDSFRALALPARFVAMLPVVTVHADFGVRAGLAPRTPIALLGRSAQSMLCVRTT